ncbi:hypothetical protein BJY01DRAFT_248487 [Aspergillus pseudoustus]|uniref:BTB domain-containing protein n=1 Tax=Aspergillus pseudoustus TaxID=1810923 RepID=A0ABR4JUJ0_9EURO
MPGQIITWVRDEDFAAIPREGCFKLLHRGISDLPRLRFLRRLRNNPGEPSDVLLRAGGQTFYAHKDRDCDHVTFEPKDISSQTLPVVIEFIYSGVYAPPTLPDHVQAMEEAADYFIIYRLLEIMEHGGS